MFGRIDLRDPVVVPFVMQAVRRNHAFQFVQRGPGRTAVAQQPVRGRKPDNFFLKLRRLAIRGKRFTRHIHPLGPDQRFPNGGMSITRNQLRSPQYQAAFQE